MTIFSSIHPRPKIVTIKKRDVDISHVDGGLQLEEIIEDAGKAMGLLITKYLRPLKFFHVLMKRGGGYDYYYQLAATNEIELLEVTATLKPNGGQKRLQNKIRKFSKKHPGLSLYISVCCFADKTQIHWGHIGVHD